MMTVIFIRLNVNDRAAVCWVLIHAYVIPNKRNDSTRTFSNESTDLAWNHGLTADGAPPVNPRPPPPPITHGYRTKPQGKNPRNPNILDRVKYDI